MLLIVKFLHLYIHMFMSLYVNILVPYSILPIQKYLSSLMACG